MALAFFLVITEVYEILFAFYIKKQMENFKYIYKMLCLICKYVESPLYLVSSN